MKKNIKLICFAVVAIIIVSVVFVVAAKGGKKEYTLSQYIDSGQTIWYEVENYVAKDSLVNAIYVLNNDGTMIYTPSVNKTLGEFEQMEDFEIIKYVQQEYMEDITYNVNIVLEEAVNDIPPIRTARRWAYVIESICNGFKRDETSYSNFEDDELLILTAKAYTLINRIPNNIYTDTKSNYFHDAIKALRDAYDEVFDEYHGTYALHTYLSEEIKAEKIKIITKGIDDFYNTYPIIKECIDSCYSTGNYDEAGEKLYDYFLSEAQTNSGYQKFKAELDNYFTNFSYKYMLAITTDSSGNDTFGEGICYQLITPQLNDDNEIEYKKTNKELDLLRYAPLYFDGEKNAGIQVYESYYNGFDLNNSINCLVTRFDKDVSIDVDEVGTKNILVDPSREELEALFAE